MTSEWVPGFLSTPERFSSVHEVLNICMFAHANAYFAPSWWTCGGKKGGGVES